MEALAVDALATVKAQQEAIAQRLDAARAEAENKGLIEGEEGLRELRAWIAEDEFDVARGA